MIGRRAFVVQSLAVLAAAHSAHGQTSKRRPRIGYLLAVPLVDPPSPERGAFVDGLKQLGYVDGQTVVIDYRSAAGNYDLLADLVSELVDLKVDVIAASGYQATLTAKKVTNAIPIVMIGVGDPVGAGLAKSLARPGGNVTGLTLSLPELGGKRVELLKEAVPKVAQIGVLGNLQNAAVREEWQATQIAARALGVTVRPFEVRQAQDFLDAFAIIARRSPAGLVMILDTLMGPYRQLVAKFALDNRIPSISALRDYAEFGGLMSYGAHLADIYRRAAGYVDKILKGAKPGDLPVEQPAKFELVINLKTAKALGLTIPQSLLLRADQVIQ